MFVKVITHWSAIEHQTGRRLVNLQGPVEEARRKMDLLIEDFRGRGWFVEDAREVPGLTREEEQDLDWKDR